MFTKMQTRRMRAALRRGGVRVTICIGDKRYHERAVVQNAGKNFMRKYDDDASVARLLGRGLERDKIAFIAYFDAFNSAEGDIFVLWRGRRWVVVADSVLQLGDEPFGFWALLREISNEKENYYDENIC